MKNEAGKCPHCKMDVDPKATKCPHCQGKIYKWTLSKKLIAGGILLIAIIAGASDSSTPVEDPNNLSAEQIVNVKKDTIYSFAKSYIEDSLKAPSTAKFSYSPAITQDEKDTDTFTVTSHVDSENGFGAMIRSTWSVTATYIGPDNRDAIETGENWKIKEMYFDGEKIK